MGKAAARSQGALSNGKNEVLSENKALQKRPSSGEQDAQNLLRVCGEPEGQACCFSSRGPGGSISADNRRWFDPKKFNVILFDQRGCGRSVPSGCLEQNTTRDLVGDIKKLSEFVGVKKFFVFGRSWGSSLALAYALKHPETVRCMVLGGVFLATPEEVKRTFLDSANYFPDLWDEFSSGVPRNRGVIGYYLDRMSSGSRKSRVKHIKKWLTFNLSMMGLRLPKKIDRFFEDPGFESASAVETHYIRNNFFMSRDYLLRNARRLKMPVFIFQGRYDVITPPVSAWMLHKRLPNSRIEFTVAGHSGRDEENSRAILRIMKKL